MTCFFPPGHFLSSFLDALIANSDAWAFSSDAWDGYCPLELLLFLTGAVLGYCSLQFTIMLTTTFFVCFDYHILYLKQSWFCISIIKHRSFSSKWQLPLQGNRKHGLACHCVKSDNWFSYFSRSGNPDYQACLPCVLSFNVLLIFTSDTFLALLAEVQCHRKPLSKPCSNCSSAVFSGASVNCILCGMIFNLLWTNSQGLQICWEVALGVSVFMGSPVVPSSMTLIFPQGPFPVWALCCLPLL